MSFNTSVTSCPALVLPTNGALNSSMAVYGVIVEVICDEGYILSTESKILYCMEGSKWSGLVGECNG